MCTSVPSQKVYLRPRGAGHSATPKFPRRLPCCCAFMIRLRLKPEQLTEKEFNKIHCGLHAVSMKTERDWPDLCFKIVSGRLGQLDPGLPLTCQLLEAPEPRAGGFLLLVYRRVRTGGKPLRWLFVRPAPRAQQARGIPAPPRGGR